MPTPSANAETVLILGAGVHGAAIALELALHGVPVHLVDKFDLAYGATSKSSRLIHGGLRYLEYGDFRLVRESLRARSRNLELAPQFVRPLQLHIPTARRWSGTRQSVLGFLKLSRTTWGRWLAGPRTSRGYWPTRIGLVLYDLLSTRNLLDRSSSEKVASGNAPQVNSRRYRWMCSYWDAQIRSPERLVMALLAEAELAAAEHGSPFKISTYTDVEVIDNQWRLRDTLTGEVTPLAVPAGIVNATGAWGDHTIEQLRIASPPLFGGTKGTHFVTFHRELAEKLGFNAVYAEADDGRLVFVLPFHGGTLVGTTDETFAAKPETAIATEEELDYLLKLVNEVMDCRLTRDDITLHYSGVRPLPCSVDGINAAISRDHSIVEHRIGQCPVWTLVGGKLTTWREFASEVADQVLADQRHGRPREMNTLNRPVLGAVDRIGRPYPDFRKMQLYEREWIKNHRVSRDLIWELFSLYGMRIGEILDDCRGALGSPIDSTALTTRIVRWIIEHEWVRTLSDLVERRLMLVFAPRLTRQTLEDLVDCLVVTDRLAAADRDREISSTIDRLATYYGRRVGGE